MKAKHSVWKTKLVKTTLFMTAILVAALFLGTAASAGFAPQTTSTENKFNAVAQKENSKGKTNAFTTTENNVLTQHSGMSDVTDPTAPSLDIIWDNGGIDTYSVGLSSQYAANYPFQSQIADDFQFDSSMLVEDVHWWGVFWNGVDQNPTDFNIIFYADDGTGNAPTGAGMDDPTSTALATYFMPAVTGTPLGSMLYEYDVTLDTPFAAEGGQHYWIAIQGVLGFPPQYGFESNGNGVEQMHVALQGFPLLGYPYWTDPGYGDMAFYLTGEGAGTPGHDVGVKTILAPKSGPAAIQTPQATIKNYGIYNETDVPLSCIISKKTYTNYLAEAFEGTFPPAGWTIETAVGTDWQRNDYWARQNLAGTGYCADADVQAGGQTPMLTMLKTPSLNLVGAPNAALDFDSYEYLYYSDFVRVDISVNGGTTWANAWQIVNTYKFGVLEHVHLDLSGYAGSSSVIVRFMYFAPYIDYYWEIDNVVVSSYVYIPEYSDYSQTVDLLIGESANVSFLPWLPADIGTAENVDITYSVVVKTLLGIDEQASNNMKTTYPVLHYGYFDEVGITAIVSPVSGTASSQIPEVTIANNGQHDQNDVDVNMVISKIQYGAQWTMEQANEWSQQQSNNAGGTAPEAVLSWNYIQGDYAYLMSCPIDTSAESTLTLSFRSMINDYSGGYNCYVKVRSSESDPWTDVSPWTNPIYGSVYAQQYSIDITDKIGTATQVMFEFQGPYFNINYWYVDDFSVGAYSTDFSGTFPPVEVSLIEEYNKVVPVAIAAGTTMNVVFPTWIPEDLPVLMGIDYKADASISVFGYGYIPFWNYGFEDWVPPVPAVPPVPPVWPPTGWAVYNVNGGNEWVWTNYNTHTGSGAAYCFYDYVVMPNDDWLATKGTVVAPGGVFSFWVLGNSYYDEPYEVYMSTVGNTVADFQAGTLLLSSIAGPTYTFNTFDLSAYVGQTLYFGIRYTGDYAYYIYVDDVTFPDGSFEGFEGTPGVPEVPGYWPGWSQYVISGTDPDNKWDAVSAGTYPTCTPPEGTLMARYDSWYISSGNSNLLIKDDPFDFTTSTGYKLSFQMMHDPGYSGSADSITVCASIDGNTFYFMGTFNRYAATAGWQTHSVDLSAFAGYPQVWIGFYAVSKYGNNMFIDDLHMSQLGLGKIMDGNPANDAMSKQFTLSYEHDVGVSMITEPSYTPLKGGDVIFHQGYWGPDEAWSFSNAGVGSGTVYLCQEDFWGLSDPIGDVSFWGLSLIYAGGWTEGSPALVFDVIFYEDNAGVPGAVVATFTGLEATYEDTGLDYIGFSMYKWSITLPDSVELAAGWISIQSELPADSSNLMWATGPDGNLNGRQNGANIGVNFAYDLGKAEVAPPGGNWPPGTYDVAGIVNNYGVTYTESDFNVNAQVINNTGVVVYDKTVTITEDLAPGANVTVTFPPIIIADEPSAEGTYKLTMKTLLAGDAHTNNDKKTMTWIIQRLDITPPVTTAVVTGTMGQNNWYISAPSVTLTAIDPEGKWPTGVNHTYYKIDSGAWIEYTTPFPVPGDGTHIVSYYSDDKAGNVETTKTVSFKEDTTAPAWINYSFTALNFMKNKWLCVAEVEDPTSGIVIVEFFVDDALVGNDTTAPYEFEFDGKPTTNSQALAYDAAGNSALSPIAQYYELGAQTQPYQTVNTVVQKLI